MAKRPGKTDHSASAEPIQTSTAEESRERREWLSHVEPFLDFDMAALRLQLVDDLVVERYRNILKEKTQDRDSSEKLDILLDTLAEIKAEVHYLRTAYVERIRYKDPQFVIPMPSIPQTLQPDVFEIDLRGELTGSNWWHAEPDGRWAGPENHSSIQFPALGSGAYQLEIMVCGEQEEGILQETEFTLNREPIKITRISEDFPCLCTAQVQVPTSYKFPFWTLGFDFQRLASPKDKGYDDDRQLSIKLQSIRITRLHPELS